MQENCSRRSFLKVAGSAAIGASALGMAGAAQASADEASWQPESWEAETDILVVGCGGAGISAGITAVTEELGDVLILEAAPEGMEGGSTRVSAQVILCPRDVEGAVVYQTNLNGGHVVEEELVRAWAENICQNVEWLEGLGMAPVETSFYNPEWPDIEGSESCACYLVSEDGKRGGMQLWSKLWAKAEELGITVQHDTRVKELVINPMTGEVCGVKDENGKAYKARKGVILSCGGFANNPEMIANYYEIGYYETRPYGCPYNRGDGILMAQAAGAELWHMNNFANSGYGTASAGDEHRTIVAATWPERDYIFVGPDGKRFMYEEEVKVIRHGKFLQSGKAINLPQPVPTWGIFGSKTFASDTCVFLQEHYGRWNQIFNLHKYHTNQEYLDGGLLFKGETAEELAEQIGLSPENLAATIETYNANAANNEDPEFGRGTELYSAFAQGNMLTTEAANSSHVEVDETKPAVEAFDLEPLEAPYYAIRLYTSTINTQGGPKRAADGNIVKPGGVPIPRLYGAGEMGTIYSYNYNGGGNVGEALSSGRLAARSAGALEPWE